MTFRLVAQYLKVNKYILYFVGKYMKIYIMQGRYYIKIMVNVLR